MIEKAMQKQVTPQKIAGRAALYLLLAIFALLVLFPFYFMVESSFKTYGEALGEFTWWPKTFTFEGYAYILGRNPFRINLLRSFGVTLLVTLPPLVVGIFVSSLAAYTFAKRRFAGREALFWILLFTMMVPGTILMMPQYLIFAEMNLVGTVVPLMLPGMFGSATCVFFMRQFIRGIPDSLVEAAELDGMHHFGIFVRIILPLSMPAVVSQVILWFLAGYNDYMGPLIYLQTSPMRGKTLQVALAYFASSQSRGSENIPAIMAGSVLAIVPPLVLYAAFQKFFIAGITVSGLKA